MSLKINIITLLVILLFVFSCNEKRESERVCVTIDDCKNNEICKDGFCKKPVIIDSSCKTKDDCKSDEYCSIEGVCKSNTACKNDDFCGPNKICKDDKCIDGCRKDKDCKEDDMVCDLETLKCVESEEEDCREKSDICEKGYECDISDGKCKIKSSCTTPEECPDGYKCDANNCVLKPHCTKDEECTTEGEICKPDGYCGIDTGCETDEYCSQKDETKPYCNRNSGTCYECVLDEHCSVEGEICSNNHKCGTGCENDSDCGLNRKCNKESLPHRCESRFTVCNCTEDIAGVCTESDCPSGKKCLTNQDGQDDHCVECLQDDDCPELVDENDNRTPRVCNPNSRLCEIAGSGMGCGADSDCNVLSGEKCLKASEDTECAATEGCTCRNPNSSGNEGSMAGMCESTGGKILCLLFKGECSGGLIGGGDCNL